MAHQFFRTTPNARSPQELELFGVRTLLSIIKDGGAIAEVCIFNAEDDCHLESNCEQEAAVSLSFIYEPSEQKKFYAFFVLEEDKFHFAQRSLPIFMISSLKKVFHFQFSWNYDKSKRYKKVHVLLLEMPFSKERFIMPDEQQTYWTPYLSPNLILYGGISAFASALQDDKYVVGMACKTKGEGPKEEISIGFLTEPLWGRDMQILFFSTYYGQESICAYELDDDLQMMPGYKVLDKLVLPDFCCNYFTACLVAHV